MLNTDPGRRVLFCPALQQLLQRQQLVVGLLVGLLVPVAEVEDDLQRLHQLLQAGLRAGLQRLQQVLCERLSTLERTNRTMVMFRPSGLLTDPGRL